MKVILFCFLIRSETSGSCLYSSVSLALTGKNSLISDLRVLTSIELFLNSNFYFNHPCFQAVFSNNKEFFSSHDSLVAMSVSHLAVGSDFHKECLVEHEALLNLDEGKWTGLLCILALSSVVGREIHTYYPDCGVKKYKNLFTQKIKPRTYYSTLPLHILFCREGTYNAKVEFQHNHYVPLAFKASKSLKRNISSVHPIIPSKISFKTAPPANFQSKLSFSTPVTNKKPAERRILLKLVATPIPPKVAAKPIPPISIRSFFTKKPECKSGNSSSSTIACSFSSASSLYSVPVTTSSLSFTSAISSSVTSSSHSCKSTLEIKNICDSVSTSKCTASALGVTHKFDIANFINIELSSISNSEIYDIIKNVFVPAKYFKFPRKSFNGKDKNLRSFRYSWLEKFSWLCYSPSLDGGFCLPCVLFGRKFPSKLSKITNLFSSPLTYWPDACSALRKHESPTVKGIHSETGLFFLNFVSQMSGRSQPIDVMVDAQLKHQTTIHRQRLTSIVDTVVTCGRNGLAFRGHRDDSQHHPPVGEFCKKGVGNFIDFLNFAVRRGDTVLRDHLLSSQKNATYISKTIQNDLISCCGRVITDELLTEVREAKFFSIIGDECADCSNKEQLSLVLRYVSLSCDVKEVFFRFLHCEDGLSGQGLFNVLMRSLTEDLKLDISNCRGQAYDGAGAVSGKRKGLSTLITNINSKAIYTHCFNHRLNLGIQKACTIPKVRDMLAEVKELSYFFNFSQGRQQILDESISKLCSGSEKKKKLKDVCRTRWIDRVKGLSDFEQLYPSIFDCLERMDQNLEMITSNINAGKAANRLKAINNFQFIVSLVITRCVFDLTLPVTQLLQCKSLDIYNGLSLISALKNLIASVTFSIDTYHERWYKIALELADSVHVEENKPRTCGRQQNRDNTESDSPSEYYRRTISQPLLEYLNMEFSTRFDSDSLIPFRGLAIIPAHLFSLKYNRKEIGWREDFKSFANFYSDDLPNISALDAEMDLWEEYWDIQPSKPDSITNTLKLSPGVFENIIVCLRILGTLPVTSCECERSFSALRRLKEYSRNTMGQERLNGLALLYIHMDIVPDFDKVIDAFSETNRRLKF